MLFLYMDESGDYFYSRNGSEYLIYTTLATRNPYKIHQQLCETEKECIKANRPLKSGYFHATEDLQETRNKVYDVLEDIKSYEVDAVIVEKNKINPSIRDEAKLYNRIYKHLLQYVFYRYRDISKVMVFVDNCPISKKRQLIEKGLKETIRELLGKNVKYHVFFSNALYSYGLQAVDYCCWALKKKLGNWEVTLPDARPYNKIKHGVRSEFDLFGRGDRHEYY